MSSIFLGLVLISTLAGFVLTFLWHIILLKIAGLELGKEIFMRDYVVTGMLTGIQERFLFTMLVGFVGAGSVATAAMGWVAIKGQLHYHIFTKSNDNPEVVRAYVGILGSIFSLCIAFIGGLVWQSGYMWVGEESLSQNISQLYELLHNEK